MNKVAAFDCDGALIRGDATRRFLIECRGILGVAVDLLRLTSVLVDWQLGRCSTAEFKQALLDRWLQVTSSTRREKALESLSARLVAQLRPQALARLRLHQKQGGRCLIVSASPEPLLSSLASHLGVELIATGCTDPLSVAPHTPFRLTTANCKGPEKLRSLEKHLGALPSPHLLEAYGDSKGDRELLHVSSAPHWRIFAETPVPYQDSDWSRWLVLCAAIILLALALSHLLRLEPKSQIGLLSALKRLVYRLPLLYGLLAMGYLGRYVRWRLLLGSCGIGRCCWADLSCWF